jgi:hypothetical protein
MKIGTVSALTAVASMTFSVSHADSQIISEEYRFVPTTSPLVSWVEYFGIAVSIDAGVAAISAMNDSRLRRDFGGVVYLFDSETGALRQRIARPETEDHDAYGQFLDMAGGYLAVGAPGEGDGAVYLYHTISGAELRKFTPPKTASNRRFGESVSIDGALIAISAANSGGGVSGAVFLHELISGNLVDTYVSQNISPSSFGGSVDMHENIIVVGARSEINDDGIGCGAAYIYDTNLPGSEIRLTPHDPADLDLFGLSVATNGNIVVVGCPRDDTLQTNSGAIYVYDAATGDFIVKLKSGDRNADGWFGFNVAIEGNSVLGGAYANDGVAARSGAAYLFDTRTWEQIGKIIPSTAVTSSFGSSVALTGNRAVVGAYYTYTLDIGRTGSAHAFVLPSLPCPADVNGDGMLSPTDFSAWIAAFNANDPECDQNADAMCTPTDFTAWISNYNIGC